MSGLNLHDLAERVRAALATAPEAGGCVVLLHADDEVYALDSAQLDGTCEGSDVFRLMALDHDDDGHPVVPLVLVKQEPPNVVCASCGRSIDMPPRDTCEDAGWHQPQPQVPDADVTAEDGDDLAPMSEDDLLLAVGPEQGKTWAELYARTALSLSYRGAELRGAREELARVRALLATERQRGGTLTDDAVRTVAALVRAGGTERDLFSGGVVLELAVPLSYLDGEAGRVSWHDDLTASTRVWRVER